MQMKHAFLITAYKDAEQLGFLINELCHFNSEVYIHIDKRSTELITEIIQKYTSLKNIHFIQDPIKVHFGGFSHLQAILILLYEAYKNKANDYFHLISGQDLPVRSKKEFESFFEKNNGKDFITHFKLPHEGWENGGLNRIELYHLNDIIDPKGNLFSKFNKKFISLQNMFRIKRKRPRYIHSYYGGGTWWSLSRNAITAVIDFNKKHPRFINYFKSTHCGEELFFQTVLLNCDYKNEMVNNDLRYINWSTKHNSCPALLDFEDLEPILKQEHFFARKFDGKISAELREEIQKITK